MYPVAPNATTGAFSQGAASPPSNPVSPREADLPAQWLQRQVTDFPPEVLNHIFRSLGCEDIVQVHNTCQRFRTVVSEHQKHLLLFSRLPALLRSFLRRSESFGLAT